MKKNYVFKSLALLAVPCLLLFITSCKKNSTKPTIATPKKLGLFEADSDVIRNLYIDVTKIGTQTTTQYLLFDTGSGGMVVDGSEILPASMITSTGFNFTGDSTVVDGITITNQSEVITYGDDDASTRKVYGNLAYAPVTIGNSNGSISIKRLPFFIYYKGVNNDGSTADKGDFDVMGVAPEYDITFSNNAYVTSPFSYYDPGAGLTKGFKLAALGTSNFTMDGAYVANVLTVGLTDADLSSNSFILSSLNLTTVGYPPIIPGNVTYNYNNTNSTTSTDILFDTGTTPYSIIEDDKAVSISAQLPNGSAVKVATNSGFNDSYTTSDTGYWTLLENPNSGAKVTIFGIDFFLNNEYLVDLSNNRLGLKNN